MGSGKSSVLSLIQNIDTFDLDNYIQLQTTKTPSQIIKESGVSFFRESEYSALVSILSQTKDQPFLLATGGGTLEGLKSLQLINKSFQTIFLDSSFKTISSRIRASNQKERPLFNEDAKKLYLKRKRNLYSKSNYTINTEILTLEEVAKEVQNIINEII